MRITPPRTSQTRPGQDLAFHDEVRDACDEAVSAGSAKGADGKVTRSREAEGKGGRAPVGQARTHIAAATGRDTTLEDPVPVGGKHGLPPPAAPYPLFDDHPAAHAARRAPPHED